MEMGKWGTVNKQSKTLVLTVVPITTVITTSVLLRTCSSSTPQAGSPWILQAASGSHPIG